MNRRTWCAALALLTGLASQAAQAEVKVGVVLSLTGVGASLGIPEKNTVELLPPTLGGQAVRYIVLDDASDTVNATKHARRLIEEEKVDFFIGPSLTPTSLALVEVAGPAGTPVVSLAGSGDVSVAGGRATAMRVSVAGSGDVDFRGVADSLRVRIAGSGDVHAGAVKGEISKTIMGSGAVRIGN